MRKNQQKTPGNMKNQSRTTPPRDHEVATAEDSTYTEMLGMTEREFRIHMLKTMKEMMETMKETANKVENNQKEIQKQNQIRDERYEEYKKDIAELKEMKQSIRELKDAMESISNRLDHAEERISEVEDKVFEITQIVKEAEKKREKAERSLSELWDFMKRSNIRVIGIPEGEEECPRGMEAILENIIKENFPNITKDSDTLLSEGYRTPGRLNSNRASPRHIVMNLSKVKTKEKILQAARSKRQLTYRGKSIRVTADFSNETFQARRQWSSTFNLLKQNNFQPRILYPAKLSFKIDGEIKSFTDIQTLRKFATTRPALQEILQPVLHTDHHNGSAAK